MASKKTLKQALSELESYIYFSCKNADSYECDGDCQLCDDFSVSLKNFRNACSEIRKKYENNIN